MFKSFFKKNASQKSCPKSKAFEAKHLHLKNLRSKKLKLTPLTEQEINRFGSMAVIVRVVNGSNEDLEKFRTTKEDKTLTISNSKSQSTSQTSFGNNNISISGGKISINGNIIGGHAIHSTTIIQNGHDTTIINDGETHQFTGQKPSSLELEICVGPNVELSFTGLLRTDQNLINHLPNPLRTLNISGNSGGKIFFKNLSFMNKAEISLSGSIRLEIERLKENEIVLSQSGGSHLIICNADHLHKMKSMISGSSYFSLHKDQNAPISDFEMMISGASQADIKADINACTIHASGASKASVQGTVISKSTHSAGASIIHTRDRRY